MSSATRDKAGRPLVVLAAATRILPDDTYLTEMELRQRKLTLSGRSAGAGRLHVWAMSPLSYLAALPAHPVEP